MAGLLKKKKENDDFNALNWLINLIIKINECKFDIKFIEIIQTILIYTQGLNYYNFIWNVNNTINI